MKRHKVDPGNIPTEKVVAISVNGNIVMGILETYPFFDDRIRCYDGDKYHYAITHYILKSDLLNLPEE